MVTHIFENLAAFVLCIKELNTSDTSFQEEPPELFNNRCSLKFQKHEKQEKTGKHMCRSPLLIKLLP